MTNDKQTQIELQADREYNDGGWGAIYVIHDDDDYAVDCAVNDDGYECFDPTKNGEPVNWDQACNEWPECVREAIAKQARNMIADYRARQAS